MTALEKNMVLHRFMCDQFGYKSLYDMLEPLARLSDDFIENGASRFSKVIDVFLDLHPEGATKENLNRYDENIISHSYTLGMAGDKGKSWKPFQYAALLFTERYLDLYFQDQEALIEKLNTWKKYERLPDVPDYRPEDVRTLAFQSATGSGKTLLMHANLLQYKHYLKEYKQLHTLNKTILVTPDEGLSRQHLHELQSSNIPAQLFSDNDRAGTLSSGVLVDIIDLHKLDEKKGIKRVALESFEEHNLVLVDEGHLGVGGKVWRNRRKQLSRNGFTFEYSATFNQAVSGNGDDVRKLRVEYGKSILFDYSYKFFYADGYGKDYKISNLQKTDDGEANNLYLLACLLMFYQQCRIYQDKSGQWQKFNLAPPLWVFLGKTVTGGKGGKGKPNGETETDIIRIINFLAWVHSKQTQVVRGIKRLTGGNTGLMDKEGKDIFYKSFSYIEKSKPRIIYDDLCASIFHAKGQLHISHLTGMDELQLAVGDAKPFGVINVGDTSGLYSKLEAVENRAFKLSKNTFTNPLFADVDKSNSSVNIVVGARKFAAGWNSWRVSTMGLMHVGAGEGPQIIQMFGRGVRLKGHGMSLKRHSSLDVSALDVSPKDSEQLKLLETLNIFGLKANYMEKFKEYLDKEGVETERVEITLPTRKQFKEAKKINILQKSATAGEFQRSRKRLDLPGAPDQKDCITLDRYNSLQIILSDDKQANEEIFERDTDEFLKVHLDLINKRSIYYQILKRKQRSAWHNMTISQETVNKLLDNQWWYTLYIPPEKLELSNCKRIQEWETLAVDLICEYANKYWRKQRNKWEHEHLEISTLKGNNSNYVTEYKLSIDAKQTKLIREIEKIKKEIVKDNYKEVREKLPGGVQISLLKPPFHAYVPLLHARLQESVQITPVPLNDGEAEFVKCLQYLVDPQRRNHVLQDHGLQGKEIYLMRNLSRGKGLSFFDDYSFYPDFILWVQDSKRQHILFIDPKGLKRYDHKTEDKVGLHKNIKDTQKIIQRKNPNLFLHSYIWSHTKPEKIGTDKIMTVEECWDKGIYLADRKGPEIAKLLQHALSQS